MLITGYYTFKECGSKTNPVLGIEKGTTYYFDQSDVSNYMHPLGFAWVPDGAHAEGAHADMADMADAMGTELKPGICPSFAMACACQENMSCPAPMYMLDREYVGSYSNNNAIKSVTSNDDNFGLDEYRRLFFYPLLDWIDMGSFGVSLKINEEDDVSTDIFYFCHVS